MRPVTPSPRVIALLTGHERRGPSWCWRPRGTATPLLVHALADNGVVRTNDADQPIAAGDTVLWLVGAGQDFGCREGDESWEIVWCHFRPREHWRDWFDWPLSEGGVCRIPAPTTRTRVRVEEALLDMDASARTLSPHATDFGLNALERALLWLRGSIATSGDASDERVEEAVLFIAHHLAGPLTIPMVAEAVQLSVSRFSHLFKERVGVPPARFVELRRLERAQTLLASTSMTVGGVARATGFTSQFYFATRFREVHGTSPTEWRRTATQSDKPALSSGHDDDQL